MTELRFCFFPHGLRAEEAAVFLSVREMLCLETYANLKSPPAPLLDGASSA